MAQAIRDYETRAGHYFTLEPIEVQTARAGSSDPTRVKRDEAEALLRRLPDDAETFALTRTGKAIDTRHLAERLQRIGTYGPGGVAFVIGGAFGLDESVIERCRHRLSLSRFTLPHELARLVLAEQLYRAGTLLRGEPYHKGS
jgi:23S rRNA (pseudouridine1915-N3)-methyltransferase